MCREECYAVNTDLLSYSHKPEVKYIDTRFMTLGGYDPGNHTVFIGHSAEKTEEYLLSAVNATDGFIPMGVEIEVEHTNETSHEMQRNEATAEALMELHEYSPHYIDESDSRLNQLIIAKTDGSLNHGVEFVTQPLTLRAHRLINWEALQNKGFYAWNASTAGMHVHLPKSYFTTTQMWLFLKLFQNLWTSEKEYFNWLAGRAENSWAKRNLPHRNNATNQLLAVAATKWDDRRDRYSALNFNNAYTVELRFFRSNMNTDGLISRLEFIQAAYDFVCVLSRLDKSDMFDAINFGLSKQLHLFMIANRLEYPVIAERLLNTNKFGATSDFVNEDMVIPSIINGLSQVRKGA